MPEISKNSYIYITLHPHERTCSTAFNCKLNACARNAWRLTTFLIKRRNMSEKGLGAPFSACGLQHNSNHLLLRTR